MTKNKRYFKREWETEYYIFDSETISEKEFDEKIEYDDYNAFADSMQGDEVVDKLNNLHEEVQAQIIVIEGYQERCDAIFIEKETMKKEFAKIVRTYEDEILRLKTELEKAINLLNKEINSSENAFEGLLEENEQLKRRVQQLEDNIMNKVEVISGDLRIV